MQPKVAAKEHGGALEARGSRPTALTHVVGSSQVVSGSAANSPVSEVGALSSTAAFAVGATAKRATLQPPHVERVEEEEWPSYTDVAHLLNGEHKVAITVWFTTADKPSGAGRGCAWLDVLDDGQEAEKKGPEGGVQVEEKWSGLRKSKSQTWYSC